MSHEYPDDLVQLQRDLNAAKAELKKFLDEHPNSPEPMGGWHRKMGEGSWYESRRDPSPGWSEEEKQREVELRAQLLALIDQVHTHRHWETLSGPDLVKARMKAQARRRPRRRGLTAAGTSPARPGQGSSRAARDVHRKWLLIMPNMR